MVLKIYSRRWHEIVDYLRRAANTSTRPPWPLYARVNAWRSEVDGQTDYDPDELGRTIGSFRKAKICAISTFGGRLETFARTETDLDHYLVFDLGENGVGLREPTATSILETFWVAQKSVRLQWKIGEDFFLDWETARLFQSPPLDQLIASQRTDRVEMWLRNAVADAVKFVDAEKRVLAEFCPLSSGFDLKAVLPLWKLTRFGRLLDLLGIE
ncbi:MAG: hypothetical protein M1275_04140 [Patescibacteria group bacterium]|nr:hypothetical protein [Patescibacteria group bacterium]